MASAEILTLSRSSPVKVTGLAVEDVGPDLAEAGPHDEVVGIAARRVLGHERGEDTRDRAGALQQARGLKEASVSYPSAGPPGLARRRDSRTARRHLREALGPDRIRPLAGRHRGTALPSRTCPVSP